MENEKNKLTKEQKKEKKKKKQIQKKERKKQEEIQRKEKNKQRGIKRKQRLIQREVQREIQEKRKRTDERDIKGVILSGIFLGCIWMIIAFFYAGCSHYTTSDIEDLFEDISNTFYVSDNAYILSDQFKKETINKNLNYEYTEEKPQVVVITVPTIGRENMDIYSFKMFNKLEIGDRALENGVLIVLALEEQEIRVEVGYGLQDVLTNSKTDMLIEKAQPNLLIGKFDDSIKYILENICDEINKKYAYDQNLNTHNLDNNSDYSSYEYKELFIENDKRIFADSFSYMGEVLVVALKYLLIGEVIYIIDGIFFGGILLPVFIVILFLAFCALFIYMD